MASGLADTSEANALLLIFNNTAWANVGNAAGLQPSGAAGSLFVGLSTGTLADASTQTTTQAAYTNYTRVGVARSGAGWTVASVVGANPATATNAAAITFPTSSSGPETETDVCVGLITGVGAGDALYWGVLNAPLVVNNNITPSFAIGALVCTLG